MKIGDKLTISKEIIDISGNVMLSVGQEVTIREVERIESYYSKFFGYFIPEQVTGFKLVDIYGSWSPDIFNISHKTKAR